MGALEVFVSVEFIIQTLFMYIVLLMSVGLSVRLSVDQMISDHYRIFKTILSHGIHISHDDWS